MGRDRRGRGEAWLVPSTVLACTLALAPSLGCGCLALDGRETLDVVLDVCHRRTATCTTCRLRLGSALTTACDSGEALSVHGGCRISCRSGQEDAVEAVPQALQWRQVLEALVQPDVLLPLGQVHKVQAEGHEGPPLHLLERGSQAQLLVHAPPAVLVHLVDAGAVVDNVHLVVARRPVRVLQHDQVGSPLHDLLARLLVDARHAVRAHVLHGEEVRVTLVDQVLPGPELLDQRPKTVLVLAHRDGESAHALRNGDALGAVHRGRAHALARRLGGLARRRAALRLGALLAGRHGWFSRLLSCAV